ncbi:MAG: hypothetical protein NZ937_05920 [Armatimonadetes bacterium]|nr:hypothetical protein [Armatimonadota bacterium]
MRNSARLLLWMSVILVSQYAIGQQQNELLPQFADDGTVVWQIAQPRDLFQRVGISIPLWLPDATIGIRILFPTGPFPLGQVPDVDSYAARPQISANGQWLIHHDENGQLMLWQILIDANGNKTLATYPTQLVIRQRQVLPSGILPAISGNGRIIAFLSQDPNLHDPDGDNDPNNNNPSAPSSPPVGLWLLYIHDRDADGDGVFDELEEGATKTTFLSVPSSNPLFVRLTEVRLSLDSMGASLAFSMLSNPQPGVYQWELWHVPNVQDIQNNPPQRIAYSLAPFSAPSIVGSYLAFTASGPFSWDQITPPTPPVAGVHVINMLDLQNRSLLIETNGVNGAPVLSRDGNLLAFHTTGTMYRVNGGQWWLFSDRDRNGVPEDFNGDKVPDFDRNAVDDVFVFDLTPMQQTPPAPPTLAWSTLIVRSLGTGNPPIAPFAPCINPSLPSSSVNLIAFQEIVNGQSRVRIVNR